MWSSQLNAEQVPYRRAPTVSASRIIDATRRRNADIFRVNPRTDGRGIVPGPQASRDLAIEKYVAGLNLDNKGLDLRSAHTPTRCGPDPRVVVAFSLQIRVGTTGRTAGGGLGIRVAGRTRVAPPSTRTSRGSSAGSIAAHVQAPSSRRDAGGQRDTTAVDRDEHDAEERDPGGPSPANGRSNRGEGRSPVPGVNKVCLTAE